MQRRVFNCATIRVANTKDMSGTVAADEINGSLWTAKGSKLWRIACSIFLGFLTVAGLFVALAPMPAGADDDKDRHRGREDNDKGIRAEITAFQAQVASLQSTVSGLQTANTEQQNEINSLQTSNAKLQTQVSSLQTSNTTLQHQLANAKNVLALDPFVRVDPNPEIGVIGPNIIFSGANIHIVSGSGRTDDTGIHGTPTGLGNLIIGYNEDPGTYVDSSPFDNLPLSPLKSGDRGGSHNLVIGAANRFTQATYGGLVVGTANTVDGYGASVSGGAGNTARSYGASASGGFSNTAGSFFSSVSGGRYNVAALFFTSVSGGDSNTAGDGHYGVGASVSGGAGNTASGDYASVTGGSRNNAFDLFTSITGGTGNTAGSVVTFQGGLGASVLGGSGNNAGGRNSVVIGGQNITDNKDNSIAPQPPFP
jgi:hypothetical protein